MTTTTSTRNNGQKIIDLAKVTNEELVGVFKSLKSKNYQGVQGKPAPGFYTMWTVGASEHEIQINIFTADV